MQIPIAIIEKDGDTNTGCAPDLPGVSITARTSSEILDAVNKRITEPNKMQSHPKPVSRLSVEETEFCSYVNAAGEEQGCSYLRKKDGLCLKHWKKLYGHPYGNTLKSCPLCGESDPEILSKPDSSCSFKIKNSDWENILEKMKFEKRGEWAKERRELRLNQIEGKLRCSKTLDSGSQCVREATENGICFRHNFRELESKRQANILSA